MKILILTSVSAFLTTFSLPAATVYDSITANTLGGANTTITGPNSSFFFFTTLVQVPNHEVAVRFQTGPNPSTFEQLDFGLNAGNGSGTDPVEVSLGSGNAAPGANPTPLGSVAPTGTSTTEILTIAPTVPISLAANSTYWLHFKTSGNSPLYTLSTILGGTASGTWSVDEVSILQPLTNPNWNSQPSVIPALRIQATETIPEPSSHILLLLAALAPITIRHRHSSTTSL